MTPPTGEPPMREPTGPTAPGSATPEALHADARSIFTHALEQASIAAAFDQHFHFDGAVLVHHPFPGSDRVLKPLRIDLAQYKHPVVIALGKAAAPMLEILLSRLPKGLCPHGICAAPVRPDRRSWRFRYYTAGHPLPNEDSFRAAQAALRLLRKTTARSFVFFLISGGGSTLFELPLDPSVSLDDTIAFHEALIGCGATIAEINVVRKHFSAVKGGRLAAAAPDARQFTLQVADVPLRHLDALASAPTLPDRSTVAECREILARYHLLEKFPLTVRRFFAADDLPETPGEKAYVSGTLVREDSFAKAVPLGGNAHLDTLLSNHDLLNAARTQAKTLGYRVVIDNTCDEWNYAEAAHYLLARLFALREQHPGERLCLLSGGELSVKLTGAPGTGGRNQQFALACAVAMAAPPWNSASAVAPPGTAPARISASGIPPRIAVLSAGSDGIDGNSNVAGAIADISTVTRARAYGYDPEKSLATFNACPLFTALGDTVLTGPTGNNLRDLRILLSQV